MTFSEIAQVVPIIVTAMSVVDLVGRWSVRGWAAVRRRKPAARWKVAAPAGEGTPQPTMPSVDGDAVDSNGTDVPARGQGRRCRPKEARRPADRDTQSTYGLRVARVRTTTGDRSRDLAAAASEPAASSTGDGKRWR